MEPIFKIGDIVEIEVLELPRWWQFWKKPRVVIEKFICVAAGKL